MGPRAAALSVRTLQVLKVAILAEKYAVDYTWYVDTILNLIRIAGDYVSEEVWYRVIQIVINRDDVQGYAAKTVFEVRPRRALGIRRGVLAGVAGLPVSPAHRSGRSRLLCCGHHLCLTLISCTCRVSVGEGRVPPGGCWCAPAPAWGLSRAWLLFQGWHWPHLCLWRFPATDLPAEAAGRQGRGRY